MNDWYQDKKIIVAVTGGIAAYKAANLVRTLVQAGAMVRVMMTSAAEEFITAKTMAVLSQHAVLTNAAWHDNSAVVEHVSWARWADLILVVPATANVIGKIANGLADEVVTATLMASPADKVIAPAMNDSMWDNPAVQRNVQELKTDGWLVIEPVTGFLAEGYEAKGRLAAIDDIVAQIPSRLLAQRGALRGKRVVITAGGTREALDPVRYLTNRSSGKMGYALAQAAVEAGAGVTLISTVKRSLPYGVELVEVTDARQMLAALETALPTADVVIGAAAVADYRPATVAAQKIKKSSANSELTLQLVENPDLLATIGANKRPEQILVGFAAETQDLLANAKVKLDKKQADLIIANDVSAARTGFDSDQNEVTVIGRQQVPKHYGPAAKITIARLIMADIASLLG